MVSREHSTQTEQIRNQYREYFGLTSKNVLKFLSSLILPLMFGIFTVVVTFEQQNVARQQRLEDKNDSQAQRKQDWDIATLQRQTENKILSDRYRDEVLVAYIKEISDLLKENNGSLTVNPLTHAIARVKTLNTLRQLDGSRQAHVIRFLHEARQLTNTAEFVALDISTAELIGTDFYKLSRLLYSGNIPLAGVVLQNCTFEKMLLKNVTFTSAHLDKTNFSSARLHNVDFSSAQLDNLNFSSAQLHNVNFSSAQLYNVNFSSAWFTNGHGASNFHDAKMAGTIFTKCGCSMVNFTSANLKGSSFYGATLSQADFSLANLQGANFINTTITDTQLQSALFIRNAKLPNGTLGLGRNLIRNGGPSCNRSLVDHWQVQNGNIVVVLSKENGSQCQFILQSLGNGAIMSQSITLVGIWDFTIWTHSYVELQARMSKGVSIELSGRTSNGTVLDNSIADSTENKITMLLDDEMQELKVVVKFNAHNDERDTDNIWCNNIELFVDYDMW